MQQGSKAALKGKLPGEPAPRSRKPKGQLASPKQPYSRLDRKQFEQLLGSKPCYPSYLDFNQRDYALCSLDFLIGCPDIIKELDFSNNQLVDCSGGVFEHLSKLKALIIDNNSLQHVQFKGLTSLTTLSLANNQLNYLNDMSDLKSIVYLDLSGNRLEAGFDQICKLKSLKVLDLGSNAITSTRSTFWKNFKSLARLPKLQYLNLAGNPCTTTVNKYRLFVINEFKQIKFLDWVEITKEERMEATRLDAEGEWQEKRTTAEPIPQKGTRDRFGGVDDVVQREQDRLGKQKQKTGKRDKDVTPNRRRNGAISCVVEGIQADLLAALHLQEQSASTAKDEPQQGQPPKEADQLDGLLDMISIDLESSGPLSPKVAQRASSNRAVDLSAQLEQSLAQFESSIDTMVLKKQQQEESASEPIIEQPSAVQEEEVQPVAHHPPPVAEEQPHPPSPKSLPPSPKSLPPSPKPQARSQQHPPSLKLANGSHLQHQRRPSDYKLTDEVHPPRSPSMPSIFEQSKHSSLREATIVLQNDSAPDSAILIEDPETNIVPPVPEPPQVSWVCLHRGLDCRKKLDMGSFGTSFKGTLGGVGPVTIKKLLCQRFKDSFLNELREESSRLSELQHPSLGAWVAICVDMELCSVMEYIKGKSLHDYLQQPNTEIRLDWVLDVAKDVANAMLYLHEHGIVHARLKTKNIIVERHEGIVAVTDYGLFFVKEEVAKSRQLDAPQYTAPEVMMKMIPTAKSDVYSYAMVLCELFSRVAPFDGVSPLEIIKAVRDDNQRPPIPNCPYVFTRLIPACWNHSPQQRPGFDTVVKILHQSKEDLIKFPPNIQPFTIIPHPEAGHLSVPCISAPTPTRTTSIQGNVIEVIRGLLESSNDQHQLKGMQALYKLAANEEHRNDIIMSPLLPLIVQLVNTADDIIKEHAAVVLGMLAEGEDNANSLGEEGALSALLVLCGTGGDDMVMAKSLKSLERLISQSEKNIDRAGESVVSVLLGLAKASTSELVRMQAVTTLNTILPRESNQLLFCKLGGVQLLLGVLNSSENPGVQLRVVESLALLTTNDKMDTVVRKIGVLARLASLLDTKSPLLLQQAIRSIARFSCRPALKEDLSVSSIMPMCMRMISEGIADEKMMAEVLLILVNFTEDTARVAMIQQYGGILPYLQALYSPNYPAEITLRVARLLLQFLSNDINKRDLINKKGVFILLEVARVPGCLEEVQSLIVECLYTLTSHADALVLMAKEGAVALIASQFLDLQKPEKVLTKAVGILALLSEAAENKDLFPDSDAICAMVPLFESPVREIQDGVITTFANLADHEPCRKIIVEEGAVGPILVALQQYAEGSDGRMTENLIKALSYIVLEVDSHDTVRAEGMETLVRLLSHERLPVVSLTLKTLLLLLLKSQNREAAREAGVMRATSAMEKSSNRAIAAASQKLASLLLHG